MTKTAVLLAFIVCALASVPVHAQQRVFVSVHGLDTNPCTESQPCRTFQQAYKTAAANGEINVLDAAEYGPLTITHGISIQAHGFGGITRSVSCATCAAITIAVTTSDPVSLNGLLIDGGGSDTYGIYITSGPSVQIFNSVVRQFQYGIYDLTMSQKSNLLIEDTIVSDNRADGILIAPRGGSVNATLNRITANNNLVGVHISNRNTTIANSVISNNADAGLQCACVAWLAKTVISGNQTGVYSRGATVNSYGDNYINDNPIPVLGSLTPVSTQ
jgi:Periplasmic copper-binding protein (NosD)